MLRYLFSKTKRYSILLFLILINRPKSILEIGVYNGVRAREMIEAAKVFNLNINYYGFDLFEIMNKNILTEELSKMPLSEKQIDNFLSKIANIQLFKGYSQITLKSFKEKVDFVFIDGGHKIETIENDWRNCQKLLKKNSVVIFDDYFFNNKNLVEEFGCNKVVKQISNKEYNTKNLYFIDKFTNQNEKLEIGLFFVKKIN
jgi:predicted O-methyltransferase YrrM